MQSSTHSNEHTPTSIIQLFKDPATIDSTIRGLLRMGVHPSDVRVFSLGAAARELRNHSGVAAFVEEVDPDMLRATLNRGPLDEDDVSALVANILDGRSMLVVRAFSDMRRERLTEYIARRREDERYKLATPGSRFDFALESERAYARVGAREKARARRGNRSMRYARASRTADLRL